MATSHDFTDQSLPYSLHQHGIVLLTRYKVVRLQDGLYQSLYDTDHTYELGQTYVQAARRAHQGGYYAHELVWTEWDRYGEPYHVTLREAFLAGAVWQVPEKGTYAILRCTCWGSRVEYASGKEAYEHMRIEAETERFDVS